MSKIDVNVIKTLLSVHGTDVSRWPNINVKEALAFIESNPEAKSLFAQAAQLDEELALYSVPVLDAAKVRQGLEDRMNESAYDPAFVPQTEARRSYRIAGVVAVVACLAVVIASGLLLRSGSPSIDDISASQNIAQAESIDTLFQEYMSLENQEILSNFMDG